MYENKRAGVKAVIVWVESETFMQVRSPTPVLLLTGDLHEEMNVVVQAAVLSAVWTPGH